MSQLPGADYTQLNNGVRVATEDNGSPTATVGVYLDMGTRYETAANNGASHFLEHMVFKVSSLTFSFFPPYTY